MKGPGKILTSLLMFIAFQGFSQAVAQPGLHRVLDSVDLPAELNPLRKTGCLMEFQEEWELDPARSSISKKVEGFELSCEDRLDLDFPANGELRIKNISYEFSFLDLQKEAAPVLQEEAVRKLQSDFIDLIIRRLPISEHYNPKEQLLSIYFHEDWSFEADMQEIRKQVKGITPVIWQQRQTAEGEAVPDPETGYPVYYKLKLERIDLRQPYALTSIWRVFLSLKKIRMPMSGENLSSTYSERISHFAEAVRLQTRRINLFSLARLLVLVAVIWLLVSGIKTGHMLFFLLSALMLILFLSLVSIFNRLKGERDLLTQLLLLNEKELACLNHDFYDLPDGSEHADKSHAWSHDLDLFGKGSLFQYLNRTSTLTGSKILAEMLTTEPDSVEAVLNRQLVTEDLRERIDFRQYYTASGAMVKEKPEDLSDIIRWLDSSAYISKHPWLFYLALTVSLLSLLIITAIIFDSSRFLLLLFPFVFNMLVISPFLLRTQRYQETISKKHDLLKGYAGLLKQLASTSFAHPELKGKSRQAGEGMIRVARLSRLLQIFDQRLNMIFGVVLNGLFLFDFIMLHLLEDWKKKNQENIMEWIGITGWYDAMISLAGFAWNHPDYCLPQLNEQKKDLEIGGLGHPLIPLQKRVSNDLEITGEKVVIITGANMAGKSTFLRSLGVNMVLAYTGCPVCASTFRCSFMGLHSSMRTADSLKDEESYFLAEIKKLQQIVLEMETGKPVMILLDEVLKGTNTTDKKLGSVGLIRKALNYPVRCFIATHDLSLGELENEYKGQVVNYCFESYIEDMELSFDYTIRKGIATNMNASFLMKKMGIVD